MRRRPFVPLAAAALVAAALPSSAGSLLQDVPTPVVAKNVELLDSHPEAAGSVSMIFDPTKPYVYVSTYKAVQVYDISKPAAPVLVGAEPLVDYENEAMSLGSRPNGDRFVIVASTLASIAPRVASINGSSKYINVVDVTNPSAPATVATLATTTRTHTVSCGSPSCEYAYSDGRTEGKISIIDLRDWRKPKMVTTFTSVVPQGHDEDLDEAGILWHVGGQGSVALDISNPVAPVQLGSTDKQGVISSDRTGSPYNNFIHHNSLRPNAKAFTQTRGADGRLVSGSRETASVEDGNVLLVTEEDVSDAGACGDAEGSFQTWYVPYLDAEQYADDNPGRKAGGGLIEPLDRWNTEVLDSGMTSPGINNCSAHYFDVRDGFVAQAWYAQGVRILDVRNARDIKQVGYYYLPAAMQAWAAYYVPKRLTPGEDLVYTADEVRGLEVLRVTLPRGTPAASVAPVVAPVASEWFQPGAAGYAPDPTYGWVCRTPMH